MPADVRRGGGHRATPTRGGRRGPARCTYEGPWREAVLRSLITLKALTYAPTGGHRGGADDLAARALGGVRNWDYRYCWLRDATFTLYALMVGGLHGRGAGLARLAAARGGRRARRRSQIMYGLAGERRLTELELAWLPGYEGSRAGAHRQRRASSSSSSTSTAR